MCFMIFSENWDTFVQTLAVHAIGTYKNSSEYAYYLHRYKDMDEILTNFLVEDEKKQMDQVLLELETREDREMKVVYRQVSGLSYDIESVGCTCLIKNKKGRICFPSLL